MPNLNKGFFYPIYIMCNKENSKCLGCTCERKPYETEVTHECESIVEPKRRAYERGRGLRKGSRKTNKFFQCVFRNEYYYETSRSQPTVISEAREFANAYGRGDWCKEIFIQKVDLTDFLSPSHFDMDLCIIYQLDIDFNKWVRMSKDVVRAIFANDFFNDQKKKHGAEWVEANYRFVTLLPNTLKD
jgi:hypothetical protein